MTDNAPDSVAVTVFDGSTEIVPQFFPDSTGNTNVAVQTTTWSSGTLSLSAGAHTLTVVAIDQGGAQRSAEVTLTCP